MGLFGGPTPKQESAGGRVVYALHCNRGKCNRNRFSGTTERKCKNAYAAHQKVHDSATRAKKNLAKLKDKQSQNKVKVRGKGKDREEIPVCGICGKAPCSMKKPACVRAVAKMYRGSMDIDLSDPAYFDPQLRDWFAD